MTVGYTQDTLHLTINTPLGKDKLLVRALTGEEEISGLFQFTLEMVSEDDSLDFDAIVGKNSVVTLTLNDGSKHYFNGIVTRFIQEDSDPRLTIYYAELRPWLWLLTKTADCRIFQNQTAPEIIETIFTENGFTDFRNELKASYPQREFCVQYNETAFAFVSRLMEEEGIFYFFEHSEAKHTLVLADDSDSFKPCAGLPGGARYRKSAINWTDDHVITRCTLEKQVVTGKFSHDDFNFETPSTDLMVSLESKESKFRVYEYPGRFLETDRGDKLAGVRIEACQQPMIRLRGEGHVRAFVAGFRFDLKEHYREDVNKTYVLRSVSHAATLESYSNSFEAFPVETTFRPPRRTPKPIIAGTQTAIVVGKKGEEIWTDKYGRIKVQFHWDQRGKRDENSSCWIRVDYGWAGKQWGGIFIPRIGQEVVVSFLEGDPDRPVITGAVYNAEQTVPYPLPEEQTKSTTKTNSSKGGGGFNEIRFEDKKGEEEVFLHAQKDNNIVVEHDRTKKVLNDETNAIRQNRSTTIEEGNDTYVVAKGNRTFQVQTGNETYEIKGMRDLTVTGNETHSNNANFTQTVMGNYELNVMGNLTINVTGTVNVKSGMAMTHEAAMAMTNRAGLSLLNEAQLAITNRGTAANNIESSGVVAIKGSLIAIG
ncbi:MAG TPA: type VI secretion system tip protein TssI/VgrG [Blastocatellia bacterium]|nr:type VI secretion system tip protein TssI/VgrG [Blastocatellia bacterium]